MCITPKTLYTEDLRDHPLRFQPTEVPCGKCWQCKDMRLNDYTGRALAEMEASTYTQCLTLTYRPGAARQKDFADKVLNKIHFQKFIRTLRKRGHLIRYLAVGEYGGKRGRAHFHCLLFHCGPKELLTRKIEVNGRIKAVPEQQLPQMLRCIIDEWPHGHIVADRSGTEQMVRYVCKYLVSDDKHQKGAQYWMTLSKKPTLGAAFFAKLAARHVEKGVPPTSFNYQPPKGNPEKLYQMSGATRRDFSLAVISGLTEKEGLNWDALKQTVFDVFEKVARDKHYKSFELPKDATERLKQQFLDEFIETMSETLRTHSQGRIRSVSKLWQDSLYHEGAYKPLLDYLENTDSRFAPAYRELYDGAQDQTKRQLQPPPF